MEPLEKFDAWVRDNPGKFEEIKTKAMQMFNWTEAKFSQRIANLRWWLDSPRGKVKAKGYKAWDRFLWNNLPERSYGVKRLSPSRPRGTTGRVTFA